MAPVRLAPVFRSRTTRSIFAHSGQAYDPKLLLIGARALFEQCLFFNNAEIAAMMLVKWIEKKLPRGGSLIAGGPMAACAQGSNGLSRH
ncbi:hypothetical protein [Bradyrhizobium manausense]|uniref:Uncharacterized protein n=1 Tax=Bradyrhizobium manausense TaxID=989370 RepID=A0A0R3E388_9BRAD|nr:hypothetical protein [Bradyrhizobium manausense]KRQ14893.1 hypothetical protein AOQ71_10730 [Bradyrhizobium manausense]